MSQNIDQIFIANPASSMIGTDLYYLGRSPYGLGNDMAITWTNVMASITSIGGQSITLGGTFATANSFTTAGNFAVTQTYTGVTNVTFPTSGTLATTSQLNFPTYNDVPGTTQAAAVNNGYIISNAAQTTVTLPAIAPEGSIVAVQGKGAGGFILAANTGQVIHFGNQVTSSGGSLTSNNQWDTVEVVCVTANLVWAVKSSVGNLTYA
jgi:hypothetical protein